MKSDGYVLSFIILLLASFILIACTVIPMTTTVDKTQSYTPADLMRVDIFIAPEDVLYDLCKQESTIGCTHWASPHSIVIYVNANYHDVKHALNHELNHVVYGPKHKEER